MKYYKIIRPSTILVGQIIIVLQLNGLRSLENGVARLPPMGWSAWGIFGCTKCENLQDTDCLSENTIKNAADLLVAKKFADVGYEYIIMDDCWQSEIRDAEDKLKPDPKIFPSGMKDLAKYIHQKNLKLGIFSDLGNKSGGGYPGSFGHFEIDANTFAEWEVDYIKMTAYGYMALKQAFLENDYIHFGECIRKTNRPMLYATSWPAFKRKADYRMIEAHCNTWRFSGDAVPSWLHILAVMDAFAARQTTLRIAHPGAWNDADLLLAGREGVTLDQAKSQMAVWSIMPSPLIFSANIGKLSPEVEMVLKNQEVIKIHQDPLGLSGYRIINEGRVDVWMRPVTPITNGFHSFALAFVNRDERLKVEFEIELNAMELRNPNGYNKYCEYIQLLRASTYTAQDIFPSSESSFPSPPKHYWPSSKLKMSINPSGVVMYKVEPVGGRRKDTSDNWSSPTVHFPYKIVE